MNRFVLVALLVASCGVGTAPGPDPTTPDDLPGGRAPVVDWSDPSKVASFDGGWAVRACEGDAPLLCVERDGRVVGTVEALELPLDSFGFLDPAGDAEANLHRLAEDFLTSLRADRLVGCGADYRFEPIEATPFVLANNPALAYGFVGTMADGRASELNLQYAAILGGQVVLVAATAYDEGGCPGRDDLSGFDTASLTDFRPHLEAVLAESPLPDFGDPASLPDGRIFGWLRSLENGRLVLDPAEMLTGPEAVAAAIADGFISEGEDLPNDFYIRDSDHTTHELRLDSGVEITVIRSTSEGLITVTVDSAELAAILEGTAEVYGALPGELPVTVEIRGGVVIEVDQQYLP